VQNGAAALAAAGRSPQSGGWVPVRLGPRECAPRGCALLLPLPACRCRHSSAGSQPAPCLRRKAKAEVCDQAASGSCSRRWAVWRYGGMRSGGVKASREGAHTRSLNSLPQPCSFDCQLDRFRD
jgi:hypothetical protein